MVYRKLLALPGLKLTHAAIDRDVIEKTKPCNLVTRLGYCWNHCKISTSKHNKLATCSLCIWLLIRSTLATAHNRSKCYETISHVVTAKVGLCVPRRSTRPSSRSTASKRPLLWNALLTKPNVESRDKCLFLIARDLVRDIRTLQRKA